VLVSAAWKVRGLTPAEKLLLIYMADTAREPERMFFVNDENTADALEISERSVARGKRELIKRGHISIKTRKQRVTKDGTKEWFSVHPTPDICGSDSGQLRPPQVTNHAPTPDKFAAPILTSTNPIDNQFNQLKGLVKLKLDLPACERIASEILSNRRGWSYDNCKITPAHFPIRKSIVTVISEFVGEVSEDAVHSAWREAIITTHQVIVDEMPVANIASYVIGCFKKFLDQIATHAPLERRTSRTSNYAYRGPDRSAGTYNADLSPNEYSSKVRRVIANPQ